MHIPFTQLWREESALMTTKSTAPPAHKTHAVTRWSRRWVLGSLAVLAAACGPVGAARAGAPANRVPPAHTEAPAPTPRHPNPPLPSHATIVNIVPGALRLVQVSVVHWPTAAPEVLAVVAGQGSGPQSIPYIRAAAIQWSSATHNWNNTWRGPDMTVEPRRALMGAPLAQMRLSRVSPQGVFYGLLATSDTGDAVGTGAVLVWVPPQGTPRLLSSPALANASLRSAHLAPAHTGLLLSQAICADGSWLTQVAAVGRPSVSHLNCAQTVARLPGTTVRFTVQPGTNAVETRAHSLTAAPGTTIVFRPGNAYTAQLMSQGAIIPLGQQGLPVFDDQADMMPTWAWTFRSSGTYGFTVMTPATGQLSSGGVPSTWVVHVP